jgi:long-chain acyl-CoA synthetase
VKPKHFFRTKFKPDPKIKAKTTFMEDLFYEVSKQQESKKLPSLKGDDLLEIVFTSGTTGDPKGVMITHENVCSNIISMFSFVRFTKEQSLLSVLPLSHLFEQSPGFLMPLYAGASVVYIRTIKSSAILAAMKEEKVTNMMAVPRLLNSLAESIKKDVESKGKTKVFNRMLALKAPKQIKKLLFRKVHNAFGGRFMYFISGGAALNEELQKFWEDLGFIVLQGYGLTECSPVLSANPLEKQVRGSIGKALPGVEIRIKDGEIQAKGKNITPGYYNDRKKTQELFDGAWMHTGDIGEIDAEGFIRIKGRKKDVIVTGAGMNVYPDDIEKILLEDKDIKDCCVLGIKRSNEEIVYASILPKDHKSFDIETSVTEANEKLNSAQQILGFSIWPETDFPRTTTLKIKKRLVAEKIAEKSHTEKLSYSENKLYRLLASVCKVNVAKIKPSSVLARDLNLDSIGRIELVSYIEQEFNIDFNEDLISQKTRVKDLEALIKEKRKDAVKGIDRLRPWTLGSAASFVRLVHSIITWPLQRAVIKLNIEGLENIKGAKEPLIMVSNHLSYMDVPTILRALPAKMKSKTFSAMHTEFFEKQGFFLNIIFKAQYYYTLTFMGAYPFPRTRAFRKNMEVTGKLLDRGNNIIFFPEGKHSLNGKLDAFKPGVGFIAAEMHAKVVPLRIDGIFGVLDNGIHKRDVTIRFGKPLEFQGKSPAEITGILQKEVARL